MAKNLPDDFITSNTEQLTDIDSATLLGLSKVFAFVPFLYLFWCLFWLLEPIFYEKVQFQ